MKLEMNQMVEPEIDESQRTVAIAIDRGAIDPKQVTVNFSKTQVWNHQNALNLMEITTKRQLARLMQGVMYQLELGMQAIVKENQHK